MVREGVCEVTETIQTNLFDVEEVYPNCTVQIWRNSVTGETSVGWWPNEEGQDGTTD